MWRLVSTDLYIKNQVKFTYMNEFQILQVSDLIILFHYPVHGESTCLFDVTCKSVKETIPGNTFSFQKVSEVQMKIGKVSLVFYLIQQRKIQKDGIMHPLAWVWHFSGSKISWVQPRSTQDISI